MLAPAQVGEPSAARPGPASARHEVRWEYWALAGLIALAAVLRFATLTTQSFWIDEATTAHEMSLPFGAMLHFIRIDETTPPLYFVLAWLWTKLFGAGEAGLRSLSALLGIGLVALAYACGKELVSRTAGLWAAAFAAVSPYMIWYSQEARSYMLFAVLCAGSLWFWARARRAPTNRNVLAWGALSALAVATHFFAGFLVAPEAVWLLARSRSRALILACATVGVVQLALLPLALSDTTHPLNWIQAFPLSVRVQQVPVDFALSSLYQSSLVTSGLLGAAVLIVAVLAVLAAGGTARERHGAARAATIAAAVILVPLALAVAGRDYFVPRNLTAAWVPLAVVLGAACAAPRARVAGLGLAALVLVSFVWAGVRIDTNTVYQRPNWRGVASALGAASTRRAIVVYDGGFAAQPLSIFLPRIPFTLAGVQGGRTPVTVSEIDVVGSTWQTPANLLPAGTRLLARRTVDGFLVERFALGAALRALPAAIAGQAGSLLPPASPGAAVVIQAPPRGP
ncbi:MAG: glycosyltransferase family 39 protein [Solirubrobacteraceae bacterium]